MGKYNLGEVWWLNFPFDDQNKKKHRPAVIIDENRIAVLAMYVTSKDKPNPYSIKIVDWRQAGLPKESWVRIDRVIQIEEVDIDAKIGKLSADDLHKIEQLFAEYVVGKTHEFTLLAIKSNTDDFLLKYDDRWKCWLFPYVRSSDNQNKVNADQFASKILGTTSTASYIAETIHCKYSESDEVYKIYHHKLYEIADVDKNMVCEMQGDAKYRWMSIAEMENDEHIMSVNDDVIAFVKLKCCH
jgi:mRNA-degrading endonuclease toxin of MazEF toxin-antitoxin module